ncbi:MAG TPA: SgcJ/EcaC family oxidoreductase [Burkholderiales bacterium]|nr:SgcJ/EcaC family oxidoreductase [Burkholderiales bacterium]
MKKALAVLLAALTGCATVNPAPLTSDVEVVNAASEALTGFVESWNRAAAGDVQAPAHYGDLYWPDAELVDPSGRIWNGQPAIQQMHIDLWHTAFKGSNVKGSVRKTRRLSPTLMIADFDLELALFKEAPSGGAQPNGIVKAHLKHVMEKRGVSWKVVAAQNTFYLDVAPAK